MTELARSQMAGALTARHAATDSNRSEEPDNSYFTQQQDNIDSDR